MPANEFEKQVQQRLDDFQLNPSASVWDRVEEELRNKKRRRIIFFILFPALLAIIGLSGYYLLYSNQKTPLADNRVAQSPAPSTFEKVKTPATIEKNTNSTIATGDAPVAARKENTNQYEPVRPSGQKNDSKEINEMAEQKTIPSARATKKPVKTNDRSMTAKTNQDMMPVRDQNVTGTDKNKADGTGAPAAITQALTMPPVKNDIKEPQKGVNKQDTQKDSIVKDAAAVKTDSVEMEAIAKTAVDKKTTAKKTSKIKWGIDLFAGASSVQREVLSLKGSSFDAMNLNNGSPATGGPVQVIPPSEVDAGFSFRIGVTGEWKISERGTLSSGVQYTYASNRIKVGSPTDTALRNPQNSFNSIQPYTIYRGAQTNDYTNSYHFASIPFEYHWQVNKKIPLQWDMGVSFNYLVATNALIYTPSYGGMYYQDKQAFYKMHFMIGTGLSYRFKSKKGMELVAGPSISFDATRLLKAENNKQYLVFTGINTKLFFPKKKTK